MNAPQLNYNSQDVESLVDLFIDFAQTLKKRLRQDNKTNLSGFTMSKYKRCLLVKHEKGLCNEIGIKTEFTSDGFSRPMYWNNTLQGWIASCKDEHHLKNLGVKF